MIDRKIPIHGVLSSVTPERIVVKHGDTTDTYSTEYYRIATEPDQAQDTQRWVTLACDGDLQHRMPAINRMTATLELAIYGYERLYAQESEAPIL